MVAFAVILLGVTLIYTGILTTGRDTLIGVAIAVMGIGVCIKPLHQFFRRMSDSPGPSNVVRLEGRSGRKRRKDPRPKAPKRPTIH